MGMLICEWPRTCRATRGATPCCSSRGGLVPGVVQPGRPDLRLHAQPLPGQPVGRRADGAPVGLGEQEAVVLPGAAGGQSLLGLPALGSRGRRTSEAGRTRVRMPARLLGSTRTRPSPFCLCRARRTRRVRGRRPGRAERRRGGRLLRVLRPLHSHPGTRRRTPQVSLAAAPAQRTVQFEVVPRSDVCSRCPVRAGGAGQDSSRLLQGSTRI